MHLLQPRRQVELTIIKRPPRSANRRDGILRQAITFGLVGVGNTFVGLSVVLGSMWLLDSSPYIANLAGHVVGVCFSYILNSKITFRSAMNYASSVRFLLSFLASLACNMIVLKACLHVGMNPVLAQLPSMATYTIVFFVTSRYYVFGRIKKVDGLIP